MGNQSFTAEYEAVGIDVGLHSFATLSTGERLEKSRILRREENELVSQHRVSKAKKGTRNEEGGQGCCQNTRTYCFRATKTSFTPPVK